MTNAKGMPKSECRMKRDRSVSLVRILKFRISFVIRPSSFGFHSEPRSVGHCEAHGPGTSVFWPKQDRFLGRAFDFDAVGFDRGVVFERVVNNAALEGVQRLQLDDVAPATDFLRGVLRLFDQRVTG